MTAPRLGSLTWLPAASRPDLLGGPVLSALPALPGPAWVAEIDEDLADTTAFTDAYGVPPAASANCVVVAARRAGQTTLAACLVLATTRADVNGVVRRHLDARKASFAPQDVAVAETGMAYGGITPIGLPAGWPVLVDAAVAAGELLVVGSGVRGASSRCPVRCWPGCRARRCSRGSAGRSRPSRSAHRRRHPSAGRRTTATSAGGSGRSRPTTWTADTGRTARRTGAATDLGPAPVTARST